MSGSDNSGDEMEAGRFNRADDTTRILAQQTDDHRWNGEAILRVEWAGDQPSLGLPSLAYADGIVGAGNGWSTSAPIPGVTGVVGTGTTGVIGCGGWPKGPDTDSTPYDQLATLRRGNEGIGVCGVGDHGDSPGAAGPGVVGLGGNSKANTPGAGVVGYAGYSDRAAPPRAQSAGNGVYGVGPTGVHGVGDNVGVNGYSVRGAGVLGDAKVVRCPRTVPRAI